MPEETKNKTWQHIRDGVNVSTLIFCAGILWNLSSFHTTVSIFIKSHSEEHIKIDKMMKAQNNCISILRDWKVSVTQKPFYTYSENQSENDVAK